MSEATAIVLGVTVLTVILGAVLAAGAVLG